MNQKGFVQYLLILLLLIGIGAGVYLTQFTQVFKPKAAESSLTTNLPINDGRYGSTPASDHEKYPRPANHIQTMMYLAFDAANYNNDFLNYVAKNVDYWWLGTNYTTDYEAIYYSPARKIKALNPQAKIVAGGTPSYVDGPSAITWSIETEQDFLHKSDGSPLIYSDGVQRFLNFHNPATRTKMVNFWKGTFAANPAVDGLIFDGWVPTSISSVLSQNAPGGCSEGPCKTSAYWEQGLGTYGRELVQGLPDKDIIYNGLFTELGSTMGSEHADYMSGALSEHTVKMIESPQIFRQYLETVDKITAKGKKVFLWFMPSLFCPPNLNCLNPNFTLEGKTYGLDVDLERFYLTAYLLIQKNPLTFFGYHPGPFYDGISGYYFYKDQNLDFGTPQGGWVTSKYPDLYARLYSNGYAVVNASSQVLDFTLPQGQSYYEWDPLNGSEMPGTVLLPPKSGKFYFQNTNPVNPSCGMAVNGFSFTNNTSYYYTASEGYFPILVRDSWKDHGPAFFAYKTQVAGTVPVNSFFYTNRLSRYLTTNQAYFPTLERDGWTNEGIMFYAYPTQVPGTTPIYSFHHSNRLDRYLSTNSTAPADWTNEGIYFYAFPTRASSCSASSSPSPTPSASPSFLRKVGDIDLDGDVDIFDFNTFVTDFPSKNLRSDLDGNGKVDIFDFNLLVQNFGK